MFIEVFFRFKVEVVLDVAPHRCGDDFTPLTSNDYVEILGDYLLRIDPLGVV